MRIMVPVLLLGLLGSSLLGLGARASHAQPVRLASEARSVRMTAIAYPRHMYGRRTASGESYDPTGLTVAHRTLPFGSRLELVSRATGRSVMVTVNDRGSVLGSADLITSTAAMRRLGLTEDQPAEVTVNLWPAPLVESESQGSPSAPDPKRFPTFVPSQSRALESPKSQAPSRSERAAARADNRLPRFSIQMGAYSDRSSADAVASTMKDAWIQTASVQGQSIYRVFYGRYQGRAEAEGWQARLEQLGISGFVLTLRR